MRNLFDQYSQPENRLTHALAFTLHEDKAILASFLRFVGVSDAPPADRLRILEQRLPGEEIKGVELTEDESERRGLPDICIFDENADEPWALLIESKVQAKAGVDQLKRHRSTVARRGFRNATVVLITIDPPPPREALPDGVRTIQWRQIYAWLRRSHGAARWSQTMTAYMEVFETKMVADEYSIRGTITMFDGLRFDDENSYSYPEAKRLIRLLGDELRGRKKLAQIGMDPDGKGRGTITGRARDGVWDLLPLKGARGADLFTAHPHLTYSINRTHPGLQLSVPNGVKGGFRKRLEALGADGFEELLREVDSNLRDVVKTSRHAKPNVHVVQRHWPSRSAPAIEDAKISFDLRTVVPRGRDHVKYQPEWAAGMYLALTQKRSNIGFGLGVSFSYECPIVRSPAVVDLFVDAWLALAPAVKLAAPDALSLRRKAA